MEKEKNVDSGSGRTPVERKATRTKIEIEERKRENK